MWSSTWKAKNPTSFVEWDWNPIDEISRSFNLSLAEHGQTADMMRTNGANMVLPCTWPPWATSYTSWVRRGTSRCCCELNLNSFVSIPFVLKWMLEAICSHFIQTMPMWDFKITCSALFLVTQRYAEQIDTKETLEGSQHDIFNTYLPFFGAWLEMTCPIYPIRCLSREVQAPTPIQGC